MSVWSGRRRRIRSLTPQGLRVLALTLLIGVVGSAWVRGPHAVPAGAASSSGPELLLASQSEWVEPPTGGGPASFDLSLAPIDLAPGAEVTVELFNRLLTQSSFENDLKTTPPSGAAIDQTASLAVSSLPPDAKVQGAVDLDITVVTGTGTTTSASPSLALGCAYPSGTGNCTGVYPVVVQLSDAGALSRFTTFLTYSSGPSSHALQFAWIAPVSAPIAVHDHPSSATKALAPLGAGWASALEGLVTNLRANPSVPVTVQASPETLQALEGAGAAGRAAVSELATLSADQSTHEVPAAPYAPIDLNALAGAGQAQEIAEQMSVGAAVLKSLRVQTTSGTWVAPGNVGTALAAGLADVHADSVVVNSTLVDDLNTKATWASTTTLTFRSTASSALVPAAVADTQITKEIGAGGKDPSLAASQLLADLAFIHFEQPYTPDVRGIVYLPSQTMRPNETFDRTLLAGLDDNPNVKAVSISSFLSTVGTGGNHRLKSSGAGSVLKSHLSSAIANARGKLTSFESAVVGASGLTAALNQVLLAAESQQLSSSAQSAAVATFKQLLADQLHLVTLPAGQTFTLTARTGWIPITVERRTPYVVMGKLVVTSGKLEFPQGSTQSLHLVHATNPVRIDLIARSSGDSPLTVKFVAPRGTLVIATGRLTVRSTATSVVGIVLTAGALAVLLAWWARTWRTGRRRRRARSASEPALQ